jgi:hypothetical protein
MVMIAGIIIRVIAVTVLTVGVIVTSAALTDMIPGQGFGKVSVRE